MGLTRNREAFVLRERITMKITDNYPRISKQLQKELEVEQKHIGSSEAEVWELVRDALLSWDVPGKVAFINFRDSHDEQAVRIKLQEDEVSFENFHPLYLTPVERTICIPAEPGHWGAPITSYNKDHSSVTRQVFYAGRPTRTQKVEREPILHLGNKHNISELLKEFHKTPIKMLVIWDLTPRQRTEFRLYKALGISESESLKMALCEANRECKPHARF